MYNLVMEKQDAFTKEARFNGEQFGTRKDLAKFLRQNRRELMLCRPEIWGDEETPKHSFLSRLPKKEFWKVTQNKILFSRILDFTITPF